MITLFAPNSVWAGGFGVPHWVVGGVLWGAHGVFGGIVFGNGVAGWLMVKNRGFIIVVGLW